MKDYVTGSELCMLLGIRPVTLMKLRGEGLPIVRLKPFRRVYDYDAVLDFLRKRGERNWNSLDMSI